MKTKKLICIVSVTVIMLAIAATAMTGCTTKLSGDEAYDLLMEALDLSLTGDMYGPAYDPETSETNGYIFAYKEAVRSGDVITNTNVNVHCDQDASYNLHVDEDLMVDLYQETWNVNAVTGGAGSKIGDFGFIVGPYPDADSNVERIYYTENSSDGSGKYGNVKVYDEMTAEDFIASDYFRKYSLASRLEELRQMPRDAFVFDEYEDDVYQQINLVKITFTVSQEYIEKTSAAASSTCRRRSTVCKSPTLAKTSLSPADMTARTRTKTRSIRSATDFWKGRTSRSRRQLFDGTTVRRSQNIACRQSSCKRCFYAWGVQKRTPDGRPS